MKESNKHGTWIITFYGFKGGAGRTSAFANVARFLAEQRGYRIGVIDLDFEAPGLPHQPLCKALDPGAADYDKLHGQIERQKGFMELITALDESGASYIEDKKNISRYVLPLPSNGSGQVLLMPASVGSITYSEGHKNVLAQFQQLMGDPNVPAGSWTHAILDAFMDWYDLDYVFLDGRTGSGPFSPVYLYSVPHALVLFLGLNEQNIAGSLDVLQARLPDNSNLPEAPVIPVLSPAPTTGMADFEERIRRVWDKLNDLRNERGKAEAGTCYIYELPASVSIQLPYVDRIAYRESYVPVDFPHHALSRGYRKIASQIAQLVEADGQASQDLGSLIRETVKVWREVAKASGHPLTIHCEDVNYKRFTDYFEYLKERLIKTDYSLTIKVIESKPLQPIKKVRLQLIEKVEDKEEARTLVEVCLYDAVDSKAPWMQMAKANDGEDTAVGYEHNHPWDIVTVPHSYLHTFEKPAVKKLFLNLGQRRGDLLAREQGTLPPIYDYQYLDRNFPDWRRSCSYLGTYWGVPFSVNATFLLGQRSLLKDTCAAYWSRKGYDDSDDPGFFLPLNWQAIAQLTNVESHRNQQDKPIMAFALKERSAYYEWLNFVLTHGTFDVRAVEGGYVDVLPPSGLAKLAELTVQFLKLVACAGYAPTDQGSRREATGSAPATTGGGKLLSMSDIINRFGKGEVPMYMAWTDSLDIGRKSQTVSIIGTEKKIGEPEKETNEPSDLVIGRFPRDIRYRRQPLVALWVMCFGWSNETPKDMEQDMRLQAAEGFASLFLHHDVQNYLLRGGFPSPSLPLIDEELERARDSGKDKDYGQFLRLLHDSLKNGHWIPPDAKAQKMMQEWPDQLNNWLKQRNEDGYWAPPR